MYSNPTDYTVTYPRLFREKKKNEANKQTKIWKATRTSAFLIPAPPALHIAPPNSGEPHPSQG